MKKIIFLLSGLIFLLTFHSHDKSISLSGKVTDESKAPLIGAIVSIQLNGEKPKNTYTNMEGQYLFENLKPGDYSILVTYTGFMEFKKTQNLEKTQILNITLKEGCVLDEIVVREYKAPLIESDFTTSGKTLSKDKIRSLPLKSVGALAATSAGLTSSDRSDISIRGSRSDATNYFVDGIRVADVAIPAAKKERMKAVAMGITTSSEIIDYEAAKLEEAGQLTAAEWNDLHQWEEWKSLIEDGTYTSMNAVWKINPRNRYAVLVTNDKLGPLANCKVALLSKTKKVLWQTYTDNAGKAELWNHVFAESEEAHLIQATYDGETKRLRDIATIEEGTNSFHFLKDCQPIEKLEVMFVVDATGSMSDEINFLKAELDDVIGQVQEDNDDLAIKTGSVFYRDHSDDYVSRVSPLSSDIDVTRDFILKQSAGGGGDFPEAVEIGLGEAIKQKWSIENTSRVIFLVLDAPPHQKPEVIKKMQTHIKACAEKGIKLIPVTASGIDRSTEFLMKYCSILTNGTYVFITDDSGIGNPHLAPIVDDYEVEKLNELLIRLLTQYGQTYECELQNRGQDFDFKIYPNPTSQFINVKIDDSFTSIKIVSASGKVIIKISGKNSGTETIDLSNLTAGVYTVVVSNEQTSKSRNFIKM